MTREETLKIIIFLEGNYPSYKVIDRKLTVLSMHSLLEEFSLEETLMAVRAYIMTNPSQFAPSTGEIVQEIYKIRKASEGKKEMTEGEAYALLRKATAGDIAYEDLPEIIQRAAGSKRQIEEWGFTADVNWDVVQSQFLRSYRTMLERESREEKLPKDIKALIQAAAEKVALEAKEVKQITEVEDEHRDRDSREAAGEGTPEVHTEWARLYAEQNGLLREADKTGVQG